MNKQEVTDHPEEETLTGAQKITKAIDYIIKLEQPLNICSIAKVSGCSRNTVKAYKHLIAARL
ncbi:hypothetical protein GNE10_02030 [Nostoc sp. 2RC]|nr:hypothetical protein [Nostoc sp. 2RC]